MESNIAQVIGITNERASYDNSIKEILADKQILARILKYSLQEFKEIDIDTIISNIDEPEISKIRVDPGYSNTEKIKKESEEDNVLGEGKIFYDIRFSVYHGDSLIKVLINIEAQRSTSPSKLGYQIDNRIIYYISRMISAQKEVEFIKSDYDNLKSVRSIWICMDAGDDEDSINRIRLKEETIFGKDIKLNNLDKVQGVIIRLRKKDNLEQSKNYLVAMLEELLRKESAEIKKKNLSENYGIKMSSATERKVNEMCNLSEVLVEKGIEQGIEKGIRQGIEKGKITARYEDGLSVEDIAERTKVSVEIVKSVLIEEGLLKEN